MKKLYDTKDGNEGSGGVKVAAGLDAELNRDAERLADELPGNLHTRIMAATRPPSLTAHPRLWLRPAVWAAAAAFLLMVGGQILFRGPRMPPTQESIRPAAAEPLAGTSLGSAFLEAPGWVEAPMSKELDCLKQDLDRAAGFLLAQLE